MTSLPLPGADVLIVDDDAMVRLMLRMALEDSGYTVLEADDGQYALEPLRKHRCGMVVLLDWQMPGMDGEALLRAVAADPPLASRHTYILMTASHEGALPPSFVQTLAQMGARVVRKPFKVADALAAVEQAAACLQPA